MKMHEFPGTESKRETQQMLDEALAEYNESGKIFDPGDITVSELMDEWYAVEVEPSSRASTTRDSYRNVMDHIRSAPLGSKRLKDVTIEVLQAYVDEKYYGEYDAQGNEVKHAYSESTMKEEFVVLNSIFKFAVYPKEYLKSSPMSYVKKRKKQEKVDLFGNTDSQKEIISHEQFQRIEVFLQEHKNSYGIGYRYMLLPVQISYYTGLRAGELAGLCWEDVDIAGRRIIVRKSMYYDTVNKCWELKVPKNGKQRIVDFGDTLAQILTAAKTEQAADETRYGELYHSHFCQVQNICGRQHHIVFTKMPMNNEIIGSRVGHGKPLSEADKAHTMKPLNFVNRKEDGELVTTQTLKNCNKLI